MLIHVHHILVQHEYQAQDLLKQIESGADFNELAKKYSLCPSGTRGGDLGPVEPDRLVEAFATAAQALQSGETSGPVRTQFGYHLIKKI